MVWVTSNGDLVESLVVNLISFNFAQTTVLLTVFIIFSGILPRAFSTRQSLRMSISFLSRIYLVIVKPTQASILVFKVKVVEAHFIRNL